MRISSAVRGTSYRCSRLAWQSAVDCITQVPFARVGTKFCKDKTLYGSTLRLHGTGGTGRIFERLSVQVWDLLFFAQVPKLHTCRSKFAKFNSADPKVEPFKFSSVQLIVRIRVDGASVHLGSLGRGIETKYCDCGLRRVSQASILTSEPSSIFVCGQSF